MSNNLVLQLKYLGAMPQAGYVEYGFHIENKDSSNRLIILTIDDAFFRNNDLKLQEAPDLCYQKVLMDMNDEKSAPNIPVRITVSALDVAHYRDLHPTSKSRGISHRETKQ